MAEFEPSYVNNHLSVVGQGLSDIPPSLSQDFPDTKELDLSFNDISYVHLCLNRTVNFILTHLLFFTKSEWSTTWKGLRN